jgi:hypothetical protein
MFGHGKCPKCGHDVNRCDLDKIVIGDQYAGPFFHGVAICCANAACKTVLGVSIDPASLAADVAQQVARILGRTR